MAEGFTSQSAVKTEEGFDASNLTGKSVVVTGGASGLGEEMVRQFVKAGAFVTIGDLSSEHGNAIVSELGEDKVAFAQCDVTSWSEQVNLFKTAVSRSPNKQIDIVVANAGISGPDTVWRDDAGPDDDPIEPNLKILNINLIGVFYTAKLAVHYLLRNAEGSDRCLLMTASLAGYLDQPGSPQYCSAKYGIRGLMRSLRRTSPRSGMRVNIIAPWFIKTRIISDQVAELLKSKGVDFAEKADAAAAVLHLAADRSANGRALTILPRHLEPKGYIDLKFDDFTESDLMSGLQQTVMNASHRIGTK